MHELGPNIQNTRPYYFPIIFPILGNSVWQVSNFQVIEIPLLRPLSATTNTLFILKNIFWNEKGSHRLINRPSSPHTWFIFVSLTALYVSGRRRLYERLPLEDQRATQREGV